MNDSALDTVHMDTTCIFLESIRNNINLKVDIYCNIILNDYHLPPIHANGRKNLLDRAFGTYAFRDKFEYD